MAKSRKPNTARKPPVPSDSHADIEDWTRRVMPDLHPIVKRLDQLICETIPGLQFAVKWKKAYYGLPELGWIIEMVAYDVLRECRLLQRRGIRPAAAAWNHRPEPLREGDGSRGGAGAHDAHLDRTGRARSRLAMTST
jgi:hypothetical protein